MSVSLALHKINQFSFSLTFLSVQETISEPCSLVCFLFSLIIYLLIYLIFPSSFIPSVPFSTSHSHSQTPIPAITFQDLYFFSVNCRQNFPPGNFLGIKPWTYYSSTLSKQYSWRKKIFMEEFQKDIYIILSSSYFKTNPQIKQFSRGGCINKLDPLPLCRITWTSLCFDFRSPASIKGQVMK